jgi:environmental stress-induced protein Ves
MTKRQDCTATVFTSQQQHQQQITLDGDLFLLFNVQGQAIFKLSGNSEKALTEQHLMQLSQCSADYITCSGESWIGISIRYI